MQQSKMRFPITGVCLVDSELRDYRGHYFNYIKSIYLATCARRLQFKALGSRDCVPELRDAFDIEPVFQPLPSGSRTIPKPVMVLWKPLEGNWFFYKDIIAAKTGFLNQQWVVLATTADHSQLFAWALWLRRFPPGLAPRLVPMLRFGYFKPQYQHWRTSVVWLRMALLILEKASSRTTTYLATDSENLAREYRLLTRLPVTVLPIPHTNHYCTELEGGSRGSLRRSINMVSLGGARIHKGFGLLATAIKQLHENGQLARLSFTLQCYRQPGRGQAVLDYIAMLKELNSSSIRLVEQSLSEDEYYQLLSEADVVLVPYSRNHYYANTSGPFTEALAMGKPVVVTQGTWMSDQLERFGAGVTFRDQDIDDLARAICEVRDNYPRLVEQAMARREHWVAYHNPDNFINELLKLVSGTG